ncbi:unnamed protein product [Macrosiphum euphorbiae]|uniref:OTU domain-containing protein n=1 Tax=Macrosiphum euphorbiae TaxID=13131 RepID=A0AAV0WL43_9HEMI|nr:unnamed protein product [Macrosiphum euphorbiae]
MQCRYFNLTIKHFHRLSSSVPKVLNNPSTTIDIIGDGNCFYRALSWWVTGDEDSHTIIKKELKKLVRNDDKVIQFIGGQTQMEDYLINNPIGRNGKYNLMFLND